MAKCQHGTRGGLESPEQPVVRTQINHTAPRLEGRRNGTTGNTNENS